jgi:hypothetical protein
MLVRSTLRLKLGALRASRPAHPSSSSHGTSGHDQPVRHARLETLEAWVSPAGTLIAAWWSAAWLTAIGVEHLPAGFY